MRVLRSRIFRSWAKSSFPRYCIGVSFSGRRGMRQCRGVRGLERSSALEDGFAGRAHFCGKNLQDCQRQMRVGLHEGGELVAGEKAQLGASAGGGCKRVGLVADKSRESKQ